MNSLTFPPLVKTVLAVACLIQLTACGGGSGSTTPTALTTTTGTTTATNTAASTTTTPTPTTTSTPTTSTGSTTSTGTSSTSTSTSTSTATSGSSSTSTGSSTTPATTTTTATVVRGNPDLTRVEKPGAWGYTPVYPSKTSCASGEGVTFEIGTGKTYATPRDFPWIKLLPCDTVLIHYRAQAYNDVVFIGARGEKNKFITIKGVPGPNGELPVFDGSAAVSPPAGTGMPSGLEGAGMFILSRPISATIGTSTVSGTYGYKPGYLHISGLKIINTRPTSKLTKQSGATVAWGDFVAGIYAFPADYVVITDSELANNSMGLFVKSDADYQVGTSTANPVARHSHGFVVRNNYFHDNGIAGNASLHNAYMEAVGTIWEYNYFGPPQMDSTGNFAGDNIKDRSAGVIFRNNFIEGGANNISLRDPEGDGAVFAAKKDTLGEDLVKYAFVYNNTFIQTGRQEYSGVVIGHGDGDYGAQKQIRYGKILFHGNRVVANYSGVSTSREADQVALFAMLNYNRGTVAVAENNLFYLNVASGSNSQPFALFFWGGYADWATYTTNGTTTNSNWINNWMETKPNQGNYLSTTSAPSLYAGTKYAGTGHTAMVKQVADPGFVDLANKDYRLKSTSPFYSLNAALPTEFTKRGLTPSGEPVSSKFSGPALP